MNASSFLDSLFNTLTDFAFRLLGGLALLAIGRIAIRWAMRMIKNGKSMKKLDPAAERFLTNAVGVALNVVLAVSVIAVLGVPMTSMLAILASAGVAVGLALQGALSNLAGGIMILIFRPFHLEDFVEIEAFSGTVTDIGFFYTTLKTPDNRIVTIPNGTVMGEEIINYSANPTRRLELKLSVAYGTPIPLVRKILLEVAEKHPNVLQEPSPTCRLSEQGDSSLNFVLRAWVATEQYWNVKFDLTEEIHNRLAEAGITVPFRQLDVHISHTEKQ